MVLPRVRCAKNDWMTSPKRALVRARPVPMSQSNADTRADPSAARASHDEGLDALIARKLEIEAIQCAQLLRQISEHAG